VFIDFSNNNQKSTQKPNYLNPLTVKLKNVWDIIILNKYKGIVLESY